MAESAGKLTFAIIKPDAVQAGNTGRIIDRIISGGFRIRAMKLIHQTRRQAEGFYEVHRGKPFYEGLTEFMSSGPCVVMVLEKDGAVKAWRDLMGPPIIQSRRRTIRRSLDLQLAKMLPMARFDENAAIEIAIFLADRTT